MPTNPDNDDSYREGEEFESAGCGPWLLLGVAITLASVFFAYLVFSFVLEKIV